MRRFFAEPERCQGSEIELDERESQHLAQVLRARVGEKVTVLDGAGGVFEGAISRLSKRHVHITVESKKRVPPLPYELTLFQAIPKGKIMDWIVQKATELGARKIIPIETERTVVEIEHGHAEGKIEKWKAIAIESIKQCGSPYLPKIEEPISFAKALQNRGNDFAIVASLHPGAKEISNIQLKSPCQIWIGPEGDFTAQEVDQLVDRGVHPITLGPLVLRCDTAAVCALALAGTTLRANAQFRAPST
jgi:16S rRNA (uracil1498-N3)-methyltransferase